MAIALLVKFDSEEDAKDFVAAASTDDVFIPIEAGLSDLSRPHGDYEVIAAYKYPTNFHEPHETHGTGKTGSAWTLGQKWGWWVCTVCKKPSRLYFDTINIKSSFGKNILDLLKPKV